MSNSANLFSNPLLQKLMLTFQARLLIGLFAGFGSVPGWAQMPVIPANTVDQTWSPVFENGARETGLLANFRMKIDYSGETGGELKIGSHIISVPAGDKQLELVYEQLPGKQGYVRGELGGKVVYEKSIPATAFGETANYVSDDPALKFGGDFTSLVRFKAGSKAKGTLFSKCLPGDVKWTPAGKALFIRGGRLVYDIGWVGALSGGPKVTDSKWHNVVLVVEGETARLFLDGKSIGTKRNFSAADKNDFVFKIGSAANNFAGDLDDCEIAAVRYWARALDGEEFKQLKAGNVEEVNTPDLNWMPSGEKAPEPIDTFAGMGVAGIPVTASLNVAGQFKVNHAMVQPLEPVDHAGLIDHWNEESLAEGGKIYQTLCVTCHGTRDKEGSIPIALKFHVDPFKNGSDPYRMYQTLTKGYGMMIPQPQYTNEQKYALIHYIREEFLRSDNPSQLFDVTETYLDQLPRELTSRDKVKTQSNPADDKPYQQMDFGPALMWTYQVNERGGSPTDWNMAQKGINIRLDSGKGGVSKGRAWIVYEHDTMRVAAAYSGDFVDWRGIAFDGSHGTHTRITGDPLFITADAPAWQNPVSGDWQDNRITGRDGRRFGPVSDDWIRYQGIYYHGEGIPVLRYRVGETSILEQPGMIDYGKSPIYTRTLNIEKSSHDLVANLAPNDPELTVLFDAPEGAWLDRDGDHIQLHISAASTPMNLVVGFTASPKQAVAGLLGAAGDLQELIKGGPARFKDDVLTVKGEKGDDSAAFAVDSIPVPNKGENPWHAWMRLGGFDFFAQNPDRAAVCTWLGDVWLVDGISGDLSEVKWRRICTGLFQPLGLKVVDETIYVTCRDQIAKLHDYNGDDEIDYVECFNQHAQVTEHFHEFAMGLQTDAEGNFYYAKSARHALKAVVPHHGTLLRVSPDGKQTDIVATGFRAANGVCLNPDGTWIVTDQEGHWNPKNRINYVQEGGFYGNMFGYHDVTDDSDSAMQQPLCWITNTFDRSPAELVWVPENAKWGNLNGVLLNLSYGYGQIYTVPHEVSESGQAQGGMSPLPIDNLPTGVHRGRFHPVNGQLYAVGMFAWAGSQREDGGFFRIRATGKSAWQPVKTEATPGKYEITFSDELPKSGSFTVRTWDLERTARYGSKHYNEREIKVSSYEIKGKRVTLSIPKLKPTWGMEMRCKFATGIERVIHSSIHSLE